MSRPLVTVAILTFNGDKYLEEILVAIESQQTSFDFEILVVDSGSTDKTLSIVSKHETVRLHQIPNKEFGHGKTRNLAANLAQGRYIAYLTHDAIPASDRWLSSLIAPMVADERVMGVLGRQLPRTDCVPMLKYEIQLAFARQGAAFGVTLLCQEDMQLASQFDRSAMYFYSDVNSAARVDFLRNVIPYRDVNYAEDQMFAEDFLSQGFWKAYSPQGAVIHSNDLTLNEIGPRTFDEILALRNIGHQLSAFSSVKLFLVVAKKSLGDGLRMLRDPEMRGKKLIYWLFVNPLFIANKWLAYNKACRVSFTDLELIQSSSLEAQRKKQA